MIYIYVYLNLLFLQIHTCIYTRLRRWCVQACKAVANMKGIQTLDLSSNQLSLTGAAAMAKALWRCRSLHEIVLEESVASKDAEKVLYVPGVAYIHRSRPGGGVRLWGKRGCNVGDSGEGVGKKKRGHFLL